ncbi:MAG TPA: hypothetical protein VGI82_01460 [Chitinophagaceae bacterium]|jgi:outer membrane lipoprotein-sorting protein
MKILKNLSLILAALFISACLFAQTADEIISKHVDAIGGQDKLNSITSIRMEGTADMMGNEAPTTTTVLTGKGFRNESEFNGQKVVRVYTDKGGWMINPFAGSDDPQALPDEQYKAGEDQIYVDPLFDYAARGGKAELLGQEKVGDVNAYKIKLTNKDNSSNTFYIDPNTFYVIQIVTTTSMMGQTMDVTTNLSDQKKIDFGIVVPQTIKVSIGDQFSMTSKLTKIDINQPVDASIFEMKK